MQTRHTYIKAELANVEEPMLHPPENYRCVSFAPDGFCDEVSDPTHSRLLGAAEDEVLVQMLAISFCLHNRLQAEHFMLR